MPLILDRNQVLEIYAEAESNQWVLPTFNVENLTTTESILESVLKYGEKIGIKNLPIIIGITNNYFYRPQSVYYTHTGRWDIGMRLFLSDLAVLTSRESPYSELRVMIHLDHIQWDKDKEILDWDMNQFSSIMFDASTLSLEENINKTAQFVENNRHSIMIEGACDEISSEVLHSDDLKAADIAENYYNKTGVDIIVANLGTEHRASKSELKYNSTLANIISSKIGAKLCLHGTSSVSSEKLADIFNDGICKVNIWTVLERDSSPYLFKQMIENAAKIVGPEKAKEMLKQELLGTRTDLQSAQSIDYFTTTSRQKIIFLQMQKIIDRYLNVFYI